MKWARVLGAPGLGQLQKKYEVSEDDDGQCLNRKCVLGAPSLG